MSDINPGDLVRLRTDPPFSNAAGTPTDPTTVAVTWRRRGSPSTTWVYGTDVEVVRDGPGVFHADLLIPRSGTYYYGWQGTGAVQAAEESTFEVASKL